MEDQCLHSLIFLGNRLRIVLNLEGSIILTIPPTTALKNVQLTSICSYT